MSGPSAATMPDDIRPWLSLAFLKISPWRAWYSRDSRVAAYRRLSELTLLLKKSNELCVAMCSWNPAVETGMSKESYDFMKLKKGFLIKTSIYSSKQTSLFFY